VVSLLLADPRIDPNKADNEGFTPLHVACQEGHKEVVSLLADPRIDSNMSTDTGETPFFMACRLTTKKNDETEDVFERRKINGPLCADLIDEYESEPGHLRVFHRLRRHPGLREYFIGHLFALVVFHSDSFAVINERTAHYDTKRFFRITSQLPLDLQMVLCNRMFGSPKDIILSRDSEPGFQLLARTTTWQH